MMFKILEKNGINNSSNIINYLEKNNVYFTHSMMNKFLDLIFEYESANDGDFYSRLSELTLDQKKLKKDRGIELIEKLEEMKMPVYFNTLKELEKRIQKVKNNMINIKYPKELEGEAIFLEIKLKTYKDVEKVLNKLAENKKNIEDIVDIFENGTWEE